LLQRFPSHSKGILVWGSGEQSWRNNCVLRRSGHSYSPDSPDRHENPTHYAAFGNGSPEGGHNYSPDCSLSGPRGIPLIPRIGWGLCAQMAACPATPTISTRKKFEGFGFSKSAGFCTENMPLCGARGAGPLTWCGPYCRRITEYCRRITEYCRRITEYCRRVTAFAPSGGPICQ